VTPPLGERGSLLRTISIALKGYWVSERRLPGVEALPAHVFVFNVLVETELN
jgi:hypothetical protein